MWPFNSCFPDSQIQAQAQPIQPATDPFAFITEEDSHHIQPVAGKKFKELQMKIDSDSEKINYRKQEENSYIVALTCLIAAVIFCILAIPTGIVALILDAGTLGGALAYGFGWFLGFFGGFLFGAMSFQLSDDAPGDNPFAEKEKEIEQLASTVTKFSLFSEMMTSNATEMHPTTNSQVWDADELSEMRDELALDPTKEEEVFQAHKSSYVFACPALSPEILSKISDIITELP